MSLAKIRKRAYAFLEDRCVIERQRQERGSMGQPIAPAWDVVASDVPCRLVMAGRQLNGMDAVVGSQEALVERYKIALPYDAVVDVDYRITVNGEAYGVVSVERILTAKVFVQAVVTKVRR